MNLHELKCWPDFYPAVKSGMKTAELRKNDRDFQPGDVIWLREWVQWEQRKGHYDAAWAADHPAANARFIETGYTGNHCFLRIKRVDGDNMPGIETGYVLLSIERVELVAS